MKHGLFFRWPRNYKKLCGGDCEGSQGEVGNGVFPVVEKFIKMILLKTVRFLVLELLWIYRSKEHIMFQSTRESHPDPKMNSHEREGSPPTWSIVRTISSQTHQLPSHIYFSTDFSRPAPVDRGRWIGHRHRICDAFGDNWPRQTTPSFLGERHRKPLLEFWRIHFVCLRNFGYLIYVILRYWIVDLRYFTSLDSWFT